MFRSFDPDDPFAAEPQRDVHYSYDLMGRQLTAKSAAARKRALL